MTKAYTRFLTVFFSLFLGGLHHLPGQSLCISRCRRCDGLVLVQEIYVQVIFLFGVFAVIAVNNGNFFAGDQHKFFRNFKGLPQFFKSFQTHIFSETDTLFIQHTRQLGGCPGVFINAQT